MSISANIRKAWCKVSWIGISLLHCTKPRRALQVCIKQMTPLTLEIHIRGILMWWWIPTNVVRVIPLNYVGQLFFFYIHTCAYKFLTLLILLPGNMDALKIQKETWADRGWVRGSAKPCVLYSGFTSHETLCSHVGKYWDYDLLENGAILLCLQKWTFKRNVLLLFTPLKIPEEFFQWQFVFKWYRNMHEETAVHCTRPWS